MTSTDDYATTFALIDADGDGLISVAEFKQLMTSLGADVSDAMAEHAIQTIDENGDGLVSLEELRDYLSSAKPADAGRPTEES